MLLIRAVLSKNWIHFPCSISTGHLVVIVGVASMWRKGQSGFNQNIQGTILFLFLFAANSPVYQCGVYHRSGF